MGGARVFELVTGIWLRVEVLVSRQFGQRQRVHPPPPSLALIRRELKIRKANPFCPPRLSRRQFLDHQRPIPKGALSEEPSTVCLAPPLISLAISHPL